MKPTLIFKADDCYNVCFAPYWATSIYYEIKPRMKGVSCSDRCFDVSLYARAGKMETSIRKIHLGPYEYGEHLPDLELDFKDNKTADKLDCLDSVIEDIIAGTLDDYIKECIAEDCEFDADDFAVDVLHDLVTSPTLKSNIAYITEEAHN